MSKIGMGMFGLLICDRDANRFGLRGNRVGSGWFGFCGICEKGFLCAWRIWVRASGTSRKYLGATGLGQLIGSATPCEDGSRGPSGGDVSRV